MESGASAEVAVVGNEGVIGIALFMGGETTPSRAIVQSAGHAYRLIGERLKDEFHRNRGLQILLLRYTQAHPDGPDGRVQPGITRWTSNRAGGSCFPLTGSSRTS
jgi:hypothetical protein